MKILLVLIGVAALTYGNPVYVSMTTEGPFTTTNSTDSNSTETIVTMGTGTTQGTQTTMKPITNTEATAETPITGTVEPISSETGMTDITMTGSPATIMPITTKPYSTNTYSTQTSTAAPTPTPKPKKGGFDGGSFAGGIALGAGVAIIIYIAYRIYASKKSAGYSTM